jgi:hypothetical protein
LASNASGAGAILLLRIVSKSHHVRRGLREGARSRRRRRAATHKVHTENGIGEIAETLGKDSRFVIDEPPFSALIETATHLGFNRDPFDRLIAAHSELRRAPLCTADATLLETHRYVPRELRR